MNYEIEGTPMPVVTCNLDAGETMITEKGAMVWMSPNMQMETVSGGAKKAWSRLLSGESMFQNRWTAKDAPGMIAFASSFMGDIRAIHIGPENEVIIQKSAFLASEETVELSIFFHEKAKTAFFGGEGFVMQKLSGTGTAFVEIDGSTVEYDLKEGEELVVNSGNVAMMDSTCSLSVQRISGAKNVLLGGEGLFNTVVTGPGRVILQTMPLNSFARTLADRMPTRSS